MSIIRTITHALRLVDARFRRRFGIVATLSVLIAALDMLAILLLVPLLAFLGQPSPDEGQAVRIIKSVTGEAGNEHVVLFLAAAAAILFIVKSAGSVLLLWAQSGVLNEAAVDLSRRILMRYVTAPWIVQQSSATSAMVRTTNASVLSVTNAICGAAFGLVADGAVFVAVGAALVWVNPVLAGGAMAYLGAAAFVYLRLVKSRVQQRGLENQVHSEEMNRALLELVGGIKELVVRGTAEAYALRYCAAFSQVVTATRVIAVAGYSTRYLLESLMITGVALVILVAVATGTVGAALVSIGVLLAAGTRALPALSSLMIWMNIVRANGPAVDIVEAELERLGDRPPTAYVGRAGGGRIRGVVDFSQVTFRYPGREDDAVSEISFSLAPGESLGVVGGSGAGKSTLVDLLMGLLSPSGGRILVDGKELNSCLAEWRAGIGFVPQEIFLINDSIASNIVFGEPGETPDMSAVREAVVMAQLEDVVNSQPEGVNTVIGERGVRLSGGQRQRLGLARALYRRPSVLVLDEATSALDNETESRVSAALRNVHGAVTTVVIAHRLSTVRSCDRILYMEAGFVRGFGTFDQVSLECPGFSRLVELGELRGVI